MTEKEAQSFLDEIEPFVSDEQFAQLYTSIGDDPDGWFERNRDVFKELPGYRAAYKKVGKPEERLYNIIKDDSNLDYTQQEVWDLMDEAGIESEEIMNKSLDKIRKDREQSKKSADEIAREKLAQQYRYDRQKAVDEYKHGYFGMDLDNPINRGMNWLADLIISDNTRKSIIDDPNNSSGIWANAATDLAGTGADFLPGYGVLGKGVVGGIKTFAGPTLRTVQNVANGKGALETGKEAIVDFGVAYLGAKGAKKLKMKATDDAVDAVENATRIGAGSDYAKTLAADMKTKYFEDLKKGLHRAEVNILDNKETIAKIQSMSPKEWARFKRDFKGSNLEEFFENIPYEKRLNLNSYYNDAVEKGKYHQANAKAAAEVFKENNPKSYALYKAYTKAVDKATPVVGKGSHFASRKASEDTPYKTSDPNKATYKREQDVINWYKDNYAEQWRAGFKPRPVNGELMMKAWQEGHDEGKW